MIRIGSKFVGASFEMVMGIFSLKILKKYEIYFRMLPKINGFKNQFWKLDGVGVNGC